MSGKDDRAAVKLHCPHTQHLRSRRMPAGTRQSNPRRLHCRQQEALFYFAQHISGTLRLERFLIEELQEGLTLSGL